MHGRRAFIIAAIVLSVGLPGTVAGQARSPLGGTTPSGPIFDRLRDSTTRPVPQVPAPRVPAPDMTWVPDRHVVVPGVDGTVMVPGHWEQRLSNHEVYTPPLVGRTPTGDIIHFPAGTRPPSHERQAP